MPTPLFITLGHLLFMASLFMILLAETRKQTAANTKHTNAHLVYGLLIFDEAGEEQRVPARRRTNTALTTLTKATKGDVFPKRMCGRWGKVATDLR